MYNATDVYSYLAQQRMNSLLGQSSAMAQAGNIGINWVSGLEEVKAFKLPPRANAIFLDSENNGIFYIKIADELGFCKIRAFRFQEIEPAPETRPETRKDDSQFIRKDELPALMLDFIARQKEANSEQPVS